MTWKNELNESLLEFIRQKNDPAATEIVSWEEEHDTGGLCETCLYDDWSIVVIYKSAEETRTFEFHGSFAELIRELT